MCFQLTLIFCRIYSSKSRIRKCVLQHNKTVTCKHLKSDVIYTVIQESSKALHPILHFTEMPSTVAALEQGEITNLYTMDFCGKCSAVMQSISDC